MEERDALGYDARRPFKTSKNQTTAMTMSNNTNTQSTSSFGLNIHRSVIQLNHGVYHSVLVIQATCLLSNFKRLLVLHEHSNVDSSTINGHYPASSHEEGSLLARLVTPHASTTSTAEHSQKYVTGRTKSIVNLDTHTPLSNVNDMLKRLLNCTCLTYTQNVVSNALSKKEMKVLPLLVFRREAVPLLISKIRIPDLRAIHNVGESAKCIVWEGGSGEFIVEASFINERATTKNQSSSPRSNAASPRDTIVTRTFRTTWQILRRLTRLPYFNAGMTYIEQNAIALGDMKLISKFILKRLTYDGQVSNIYNSFFYFKTLQTLSFFLT